MQAHRTSIDRGRLPKPPSAAAREAHLGDLRLRTSTGTRAMLRRMTSRPLKAKPRTSNTRSTIAEGSIRPARRGAARTRWFWRPTSDLLQHVQDEETRGEADRGNTECSQVEHQRTSNWSRAACRDESTTAGVNATSSLRSDPLKLPQDAFGSTSRYPAPGSVSTYCGRAGSGSIFARRWETYT